MNFEHPLESQNVDFVLADIAKRFNRKKDAFRVISLFVERLYISLSYIFSV